jgi:hypothetical protein
MTARCSRPPQAVTAPTLSPAEAAARAVPATGTRTASSGRDRNSGRACAYPGGADPNPSRSMAT